MTLGLKIHWGLWTLLVAIVMTGALTIHFSSTQKTPLELRSKASVDVSIFRPLPDVLRLGLNFNRIHGQRIPELGEFRPIGEDWRKTGFLRFPEPGDRITLLIRGEGREVVYEALPASSYSSDAIGRDLVAIIEDGDPNRFIWPPNLTLGQVLPSGYSTYNISVLDVDPKLAGEHVSLIIKAPVKFKEVSPGYGFLWCFLFWQFYAFLLLGYGGVLVWFSRRTDPTSCKDVCCCRP